jgi:small subunit ribosomal protein S6
MRKYEVMLILPADADDAAVKGAVDRISRVIGEAGGEVTKTDTWGRRRLAFMIGKHTEGYYVVVDMSAEPGSIVELERVLHLADDIVRFKVVVKPPERKRRFPKPKPGAEAAVAAEPAAAPPAEDEATGDQEAEPQPAAAEAS